MDGGAFLTRPWGVEAARRVGGGSVVHNMEDINRKSQIRAVEDDVSLSQIELGTPLPPLRLDEYH